MWDRTQQELIDGLPSCMAFEARYAWEAETGTIDRTASCGHHMGHGIKGSITAFLCERHTMAKAICTNYGFFRINTYPVFCSAEGRCV